jgi:uncharacterized membrane protein YdfJ with MMPL/SSD domain
MLSGWIVVAVVGNLAVPQLERVVASHARSFMPTEAASAVAGRRSAELFGDAPGSNLNYVVLESDQPQSAARRLGSLRPRVCTCTSPGQATRSSTSSLRRHPDRPVFLMPALMALLGCWFWRPRLIGRRFISLQAQRGGLAGSQTSANSATRRVRSDISM